MSERREVYHPVGFYVGLAATVALAVLVAAICGGGEWVRGALLGGGAVAADFYLLTFFAVAWLDGARRGGRGPVIAGIAALSAKALLPPVAVWALVRGNVVSPYAVALGALVVATAAPALLSLYYLRGTYRLPDKLWKS
ncbi:MAG TPA: hypothetical protein VMX79_06830 [bacterium]|nr:hypothetical protein [bacterium]